MPEYVRVLDTDTGHRLTVREAELPHGNYQRLDEPAVDERTELPLPAEHAAPVKAAPKSLSSNTNSGQLADPKKENKHG